MNRAIIERTLQRGLIVLYAVLTAAGVAALVTSPPSMLEQIGPAWSRAWGLFLLLGAAACLVGILVPRGNRGDWFGEFVGLPLTASAVGVYAAVGATTIDRVPGRIIGVLLMWGLALLLAVRWWRVRDDAHHAGAAQDALAAAVHETVVRDARDTRADDREHRADARDRRVDQREQRADDRGVDSQVARELRADDRADRADLRDSRADARDVRAAERDAPTPDVPT